MQKIDKLTRSALFRERLAIALESAGTTQSAVARAAGVDRSTISQLLTDDGARLPNAHVVGACAQATGVSADWLLGLSERPESAADILAASLSLTKAPRALVDEQIFAWHREAAGYKIRHVPAALPDMLKTRAMLDWEYTPHLGRTAQQVINASEERLNWLRGENADYEIALPLHEVSCLARGHGYYADLPEEVRRDQLQTLSDLCGQLYPRLRVYLFDARRVFSAPITVFGPLLAVLYVGRDYVAFRDSERVQAFTLHFDNLVREAEVSARDLPGHIDRLADTAEQPL